MTPNRGQNEATAGRKGVRGLENRPQNPFFAKSEVGGGERPKSPQTPIFSGSTQNLAKDCVRSKSSVCVCAAEVSSSSCALSLTPETDGNIRVCGTLAKSEISFFLSSALFCVCFHFLTSGCAIACKSVCRESSGGLQVVEIQGISAILDRP